MLFLKKILLLKRNKNKKILLLKRNKNKKILLFKKFLSIENENKIELKIAKNRKNR